MDIKSWDNTFHSRLCVAAWCTREELLQWSPEELLTRALPFMIETLAHEKEAFLAKPEFEAIVVGDVG
jgi:hypothetical protein